MARKIEIELVGDASSLERAFGKAEKSGSKLGSVLKGGLFVGAGAAAGGIAALGVAAKIGFDEFTDAQKVAAQTGAVLKSTGGIANVTAKDVDRLSTALMEKSGVDDEAIASGQNLLLTFTKVRNETGKGNDIFNQATKAALNMSVAMGTEMTSSSMMLGKALNDPIKGLGKLAKAGVQFTDAQKESITAMQEAGNVAGAQKIILAELETQFGGSAEAAGKTFAGMVNIAKESALNFAGEMVGKAMPAVTDFAREAFKHGPAIKSALAGAFDVIGDTARRVFPDVRNIITSQFASIRASADTVWPAVKNIVQGVANVIRDSIVPIYLKLAEVATETWAAIAKVLKDNEPEIKRITAGLKTLLEGIGTVLLWLANTVIIPVLKPIFTTVLPVALGLTIDAIDLLVRAIGKAVDGFVWMRDKLAPIFNTLHTKLKGPLADIAAGFEEIGGFVESIVDGIKWLGSHASGILGKVADVLGKIPTFGLGDPRDPTMAGPPHGAITGFNLMGASPVMAPFAASAAGFGLQVTSGLRPGARTRSGNLSDHAVGKALDVSNGVSTPQMAAFFSSLVGNPAVKQAFYDPLGSIFGGKWSSYREGGHSDHVHVATYDGGGWLMPGLTLARNNTGRPERILPPGGGGVTFIVNGDVTGQELVDKVVREVNRQLRRGDRVLAI